MTAPDGGTLARANVVVTIEFTGDKDLTARAKKAAKAVEREFTRATKRAETAAEHDARNIAEAFERSAKRVDRALGDIALKEAFEEARAEGGEGLARLAEQFKTDVERIERTVKDADLRLSEENIRKFEAQLRKLEADLRGAERSRRLAIQIDPDFDTAELDRQIAELRAKVFKARTGLEIKIPVEVEQNRLRRAFAAVEKRLDSVNRVASRTGKILGTIGGVAGGIVSTVGRLAGGLTKLASTFGKVLGIASLVVGAIGLVGGAVGALLSSVVPLLGVINLLSGALGVLPAILAGVGAGVATLVIGFRGIGDVIKQAKLAAASGDTKKLDKALEKLAPSARAAVKEFFALGPAFTNLRIRVQEALFRGLATTIRRVATAELPLLSKGFTQLAIEFNAGAKIFAKGLISKASLRDQSTVFSNLRSALRALLPAIDPLRKALTDVVTVGSGKLPSLAASLTKVSQSIANSIEAARKSGALDEFFNRGIESAKQLGRVIGNVAGAFAGISNAARSSGQGLLDNLERSTEAFEKFTKSFRGQEDIASFFLSLARVTAAFKPVLGEIVDLITRDLAPAFADIAVALGPGLVNFFDSLGEVVTAASFGLLQFAVALTDTFSDPVIQESLREIGELIAAAFTDLAGDVGPFISSVLRIAKAVIPLVGPLGRLAVIVAKLIADLAQRVSSDLGAVIDSIGAAVTEVGPGLIDFVQQVLKSLADPETRASLIALFKAIGDALKSLGPFIEPLTSAFRLLAQALAALSDLLGPAAVLLLGLAVAIAGPLGVLLAIGALIAAIVVKLIPALGKMAASIGGSVVIATRNAAASMISLGGAIDSAAAKLLGFGKDSFEIGDALKRGVDAAVQHTEDRFNDLPPSLRSAGGRAGAAAGQALVDNLQSALRNANLQATVAVNATINGPARAVFAAGGVVESPTMALIGEQSRREVVLPLTNPGRLRELLADPRVAGPVAAAQAGGTGATVHQTFNVTTGQVNERALAAMLSARMLGGLR